MRGQKKALREYQQALIDAYYDDWIHEMLDSLYEAFQQWKPGLIIPTEISAAMTINGMIRE